MYLRNLWKAKPQARVIIFSVGDRAKQIAGIISKYDEDVAIVDGNMTTRTKGINSFKAVDSVLRVVSMNISVAAFGTNLIEADHVIIYEQLHDCSPQTTLDTETQAIGRAHRQGQVQNVVVTRFIIKNTVEHDAFLKFSKGNYYGEEGVMEEEETF